MDGMHQIGPEHRHAAFLGVLYAEDFDAPDLVPQPVPEPPEPLFTLADLEAAQEAACREAVATAKAEWDASAAQLRAASLERIAASVTAAQDGARLLAEEFATETAKAVLALLAGLLPHLCRLHGDAEVRALLRVLLPQLSQQPRITVRVHPAVLDGVREDFRYLDSDVAAAVAVTALDTLGRGDARVGWTNGALRRDGGAIAGALHAGLIELGLIEAAPPQAETGLPTTTERRMAHAH